MCLHNLHGSRERRQAGSLHSLCSEPLRLTRAADGDPSWVGMLDRTGVHSSDDKAANKAATPGKFSVPKSGGWWLHSADAKAVLGEVDAETTSTKPGPAKAAGPPSVRPASPKPKWSL